jgi:hypothetical protein
LLPASFASYNFGMPWTLCFLPPPVILANLLNYLAFASLNISSTIPDLSIYLIILSLKIHSDPNYDAFNFNVSFVCESNVGLTIKAFINTHK